jgi:flagellin-like hook-associated protein FlgL
MSGVVLSAGVRASLLALQATSEQLSSTQNRLASGHRVSSAIDNPISFFTAAGLSNRANELNRLVDGIEQAQQAISAANAGLSALTRLVNSAKAVAQQALQSPSPAYSPIAVTATLPAETIASIAGTGDLTSFGANGGNLVIAFNGGPTQTIAIANGDSQSTILSKINAVVGAGGTNQITATADASHHLVLTAKSADISFTIDPASTDNVSAALGIVEGSGASSTSLFDAMHTAGGLPAAMDISVNGGPAQTITFGLGAGQVSTIAELSTAFAGLNGVTASISGNSLAFNVAGSPTPNSLQISAPAEVTAAFGISSGTTTGVLTPDQTRTNLQAQYNAIIAQLDMLARDTSYNGIGLIDGGDLNVALNEKGDNSLTIAGVTLDSAGLGLSGLAGSEFQSNAAVGTVLDSLNSALSTLSRQAQQFGSSLDTVQVRQDFTRAMINTLQSGADSLTLADLNQEGVNLLALQMQQQLSTTVLSLSSRADQAVLRLF